ncbi:MAG TPA: c-type cytochrome domain-containing protein, partial [Candidatus Acidoferrum sp.]|nr:c-type cytochrome domain-containing protein [Candidatus Acidoferrum sp.]
MKNFKPEYALLTAAMALATGNACAQPVAHDFAALKQADNFWSFLNDNCTQCHNPDDFSGGIDFTDMKAGEVPGKAELFEKVLVKLRGRMMPPPNSKVHPPEQKTDAFVGWL